MRLPPYITISLERTLYGVPPTPNLDFVGGSPPPTPGGVRPQGANKSGIALTDLNGTKNPSDLTGTWNLSTKKSAVLPTTTAAYLALEAAAAKYAPKAASNAIEAAQKVWWDNIGKLRIAVQIAGQILNQYLTC